MGPLPYKALSKGAGNLKAQTLSFAEDFEAMQAQTALPTREGMRERVTDGGH